MKAFSNLKIGKRLAIGFTVILVLSMTATITSYFYLTGLVDDTKEIVGKALHKERLAAQWLRSIDIAATRTVAIAKSSDPSLDPFFAPQSRDLATRTAQIRKELESTTDKKETVLLATIQERRDAFVVERNRVLQLKADGKLEEAELAVQQRFLPAATHYVEATNAFLTYQKAGIDERAQAIIIAADTSKFVLVVLLCLSVLAGALFSWILTRSIVKPVNAAVLTADRIAAGDLTVSVVNDYGNDQIGQLLDALQRMKASLVEAVARIRLGSETINSVAAEITEGHQDLSSRTESQAAGIEETASLMEQLTAVVQQNRENADQANEFVTTAANCAVLGGDVVGRVVGTMSEIQASSKRVVDIISVIDGIAFQTNILALNAAVEAARAGEQGRGFAVVASEVRALAHRSSLAAKEIKELITRSDQTVAQGMTFANDAGKAMEAIVSSVQRVKVIMNDIAAASAEQAAGIQQVNAAVVQMDEVTQRNAALVEEAAASTQQLHAQTDDLLRAVSGFSLPTTNMIASEILCNRVESRT